MAAFTVMVTDNRHGDYSIEENILKECDAELVVANCITEDDVIDACKDADGLLLDLAPMTARVVRGLNTVRVISRYGVGYDNVDVAACTEKGIYVATVPDYCEEDVSDMAMAHIFCALRQVALRDRLIRQGQWNLGRDNVFRIRGKIVSLLGYGRIARALHRKIKALGLAEVLVYDPYIDPAEIERNGARAVDFDTAVSAADILSLHMPVTEETRNSINADVFTRMKSTAILINTARGALVDHDALVNALVNHTIAFAGLDTHSVEPLPEDDPLMSIETCTLTDHAGFNTQEGVVELKTKVAENVKSVLTGGVPRYWINKF